MLKEKMNIVIIAYVIFMLGYFLYVLLTPATFEQPIISLLFGTGLIIIGVYEILIDARKLLGVAFFFVAAIVMISALLLYSF